MTTIAPVDGPIDAARHAPPSRFGPATPLDRVRTWTPRPTAATATIAATSLAYAFASLFARRLTEAGLAPVTIAFARFAITAAVLAPFVRFDARRRRAGCWGLASGAAMAVGWIGYVRAVEAGSVASAGVVYMTYPLFAMLALATVFRRRPTVAQVIGGLLVLVGAAIALGPSSAVPLIAVAAPVTFGWSVAVLTERLATLDPFERLGSVASGATVALLPVLLVQPAHRVVPHAMSDWWWIVGLGIGSALIPMLLYAAAAPHVGAARAAVAGSLELPAVVVIGAALGEATGLRHVAGAAMICAAVVVASASRPAHAIPGEELAPERGRPATPRPRPHGGFARTRRRAGVGRTQPVGLPSVACHSRYEESSPAPRANRSASKPS